ncbi:putative BPI/LBP family protein At1g04970 [Impatiens glandulifera]|uniref:putative BPI/LBP family protein At1g04970 n=1 Tax=Impatiens glandulifera TaxID=253017 RepID=UPI001FB183B7|nr:putative BPI/LBP family protein At1g04970 [Impatiens glandulifera]
MAPTFSFPIIIFLLPLLSVVLHSTTHAQSTPVDDASFISVDLFKKGIDFGKDLAIKKGVSALIPFELPQIETAVKIPLIGTVYFTLSNISLYEVNVSSSSVQPGDTGLVLIVSGARASLTMDWGYRYVSVIVITDNGTASVQVENMEVGLALGLKNEQGNLKLSLLDCGCVVKDIFIQMDGGASWLYQSIVSALESKIRSAIEVAVVEQIGGVIIELDSLLQTIPRAIDLDNIASWNITSVNDPVLDGYSVGVEINGLVMPIDGISSFGNNSRNIQSIVSCGGPAKMAGISIHERVLNSASLVYFNAGVMNMIVQNQSFLNTAHWKFLVPQLYRKYPNADMILNISVSSPPVLTISEQSVDAMINVEIAVNVLDGHGEAVPVACIISLFTVSGYPSISRDTLTGSINMNDFTMSLKSSSIGSLHIPMLKPFVEIILRTVGVPYVNLMMYWGTPLPTFMGYTIHKARFHYADSRIVVCTDIHHMKKHDSQKVAQKIDYKEEEEESY